MFDLDGTLMDSSPGIVHCFQLTLAEWGREAPLEQLRTLIGPPLRHSFHLLGYADEDLDEVVECYRGFYATVGLREAELYDGVSSTLAALRSRGVRLGVATAKRVDFAREMLRDRRVDDLFDEIAGASMDLRVTDKADIMAHVLTAWDNPPPRSVWMVGDRAFDMVGARHHGVVGVGVLWGFGDADELRAAGADRLITRVEQLLDESVGEPTTMDFRGA